MTDTDKSRTDQVERTARFLARWFGCAEEGVMQLSTLPGAGAMTTKSYAFGDDRDLEEAAQLMARDALVYSHDRKRAVYMRTTLVRPGVPGGKRGGAEWTDQITGLWHEIDVSEAGGHKVAGCCPTWAAAEEFIKGLPLKPTFVVRSGGGYHIWWCAREPLSTSAGTDEARQAAKLMASWDWMLRSMAKEAGFELDANIGGNLACLLRPPNTLNRKRDEPTLVKVVAYNEGADYNWSRFEEIAEDTTAGASMLKAAVSVREAYEGNYRPGDYMAAEGLASGNLVSTLGMGRNDTMRAMAAAKLGETTNYRQIAKELWEHDLRVHAQPLFTDQSENTWRTPDPLMNALLFVTNIAASITNKAAAEGRRAVFGARRRDMSTVPVPYGAWLDDETPYRDEYIQDVLPQHGIMVVAGPPKAQKSFLVHELATALVLGRPWMDMEIAQPQRVLVAQYELNKDQIRKRSKRSHQATVLGDSNADAMLRSNLAITPRLELPLDPSDPENVDSWLQMIDGAFEGRGADVVIVDPLQNAWLIDENNNAEMMAFMRALRENVMQRAANPVSLVLVHHSRKGDHQAMRENPFDHVRGGSSMRGNWDAAIFIHKAAAEGDERYLHFDARGGGAPDSTKVVLGDDGLFVRVDLRTPEVGESMRDRWSAEDARVRGEVLRAINSRAMIEGELYQVSTLAAALSERRDLGSKRSLVDVIKKLAVLGYVRFTSGEDLGLRELSARSFGYLCTEVTQLRVEDTMGEPSYVLVEPERAMDHTTGELYDLVGVDANVWDYEQANFDPTQYAPKVGPDGHPIVNPFDNSGRRGTRNVGVMVDKTKH